MKINDKYFEIYNDNYNIRNLIKKINPSYELVWSKKDKLFNIINTANFNEICLIFNKISPNIIKSIQKSRIENSRKIFSEIEENNELLNQNNIKKITNNISKADGEIKYLSKRNLSLNKIQNIMEQLC